MIDRQTGGAPPRISLVVGWRAPGWAAYVARRLAAAAAGGESPAPRTLEIDRVGALRELFDNPPDAGAGWMLVVRPDPGDLAPLQHLPWRKGEVAPPVGVAMVDVRWSEIVTVVESVRLLPRWPSLWLPPAQAVGRCERAASHANRFPTFIAR